MRAGVALTVDWAVPAILEQWKTAADDNYDGDSVRLCLCPCLCLCLCRCRYPCLCLCLRLCIMAQQITTSKKQIDSHTTQVTARQAQVRSLLKMPRPQKQNKCHNWHGPSHNSKKPMPLLKTPWPQLNHPGLNWHIQVTTHHAQSTTQHAQLNNPK